MENILDKVYLVGGAVRDKLLGLPHRGENDWVVVGIDSDEMLQAGFKRVGKDFPVFLHPDSHEEYALARLERKKGKGYYGFECYTSKEVTLEEDLLRRDLTINAMAEDKNGKLIDPYCGFDDLQHKILRHVSKAFAEDPVRILRIARFMARFGPLGFKIADETMQLMQEMVKAGEVDELVPERVWQEMQRALQEKDPGQFFLTLRECGALERIWPDLNKLWGVPQPEQHHPEIDTGVHVMMAVKLAAEFSHIPEPDIIFAVLCHDLGKGLTPKDEWPSHKMHEERGVDLILNFCKRYRVPNEYRDLAVITSRYHLHSHRAFELKPSTLLKTLEKLDAFRKPERFEKFLRASEADARGRKGLSENDYKQAEHFRQALKVAKEVSIAPLLEAGFNGEQLKAKLHELRVQAIKSIY